VSKANTPRHIHSACSGWLFFGFKSFPLLFVTPLFHLFLVVEPLLLPCVT